MIRAEDKTPAEIKQSRGVMDIASRGGNLYNFDPRLLQVEAGWNARSYDFDAADPVDIALARSIAEIGVKEPLTIYMRNGDPFLTDGHRRRGAVLYAIDVLKADIKTVPCKLEPKHASEADRLLSQLVRGEGKPKSAIERANIYARLIDFGWSEAEVARKVGMERQTIADALKLRAAPRAVVDMVKAGTVSATLAKATLKAKKGDAAAAVEALHEGLKTAQAAGKSKATAKHVAKPAPDLRKTVGYAAGLKRALEIVKALPVEFDDPGLSAVVNALAAEIANPTQEPRHG